MGGGSRWLFVHRPTILESPLFVLPDLANDASVSFGHFIAKCEPYIIWHAELIISRLAIHSTDLLFGLP